MINEPHRDSYEQLRDLDAEYTAAHDEGMACLKLRDLLGFANAILKERGILEERQQVIREVLRGLVTR